MLPMSTAKPAAGIIVAMISLLLAACFFAPGTFDSTLDVRRDGRFTFTYVGQIHFLPLAQKAQEDQKAAVFSPEPCTIPETGEERRCTRAELAEQRKGWEATRRERAEREKREARSLRMFTGDLYMSNPRAGEELAARLRRQAGWRRVDYKGDGIFDVDFRAEGRLNHDFAFPTVENFPSANAFLQLSRRKDGTVRIDAPGFGPGPGGEMLRGLAGSMVGGSDSELSRMPVADGRFVVTTDAPILANNTDVGPSDTPAGKQLNWTVNLRSAAAPMALLRLSPLP